MQDHTDDSRWPPCRYPMQSCVVANNKHVGATATVTFRSNDKSHQEGQQQQQQQQQPLPPPIIRAVLNSEEHSTNQARTLVICLDGTGDKFDNDNSNVVNFVACLKKNDPNQVTYYQSGIGTYDGAGPSAGFSAGLDMAVGSGLGRHIKDAYRFLMQVYQEGDRICLLGFSRGAYTVRCLAGMLHKCGLLPKHNRAQVQFAYQFYKNDTAEGWKMSAEFKRTFCTNVNVYFVGVWDCVASVGFIPRKLPFSQAPTNTISYFRHAMALDEHRAKFKISQWQQQNPAADSKAVTDRTPKAKAKQGFSKFRKAGRSSKLDINDEEEEEKEEEKKKKKKKGKKKKSPIERKLSSLSTSAESKKKEQAKLASVFEEEDHAAHDHKHVETDVLEVWFTGCHADIGGGAVGNEERHMLSRIPLRWMIRQCFACNTGIIFNARTLAEVGLDISTLWPVYQAREQPIVGPSPTLVERYESGNLPSIRRRATALGFDKKKRGTAELSEHVMMKNQTQMNGSATEHDRLHKKIEHINPDLLPEHVEDHFDAMAPINDQLVLAKGWWVLEFWPIKVRVQESERMKEKGRRKGRSEEKEDDEGNWVKVVRMNMGRFRAVREIEPKMHWTVQMRMYEKGYRIRSRLDRDASWVLAW